MGKKIKIAKRHVDLPKPYRVHVMAEIERQTPRGAAIAGTAYLDMLLRSVIETLMRQEPDHLTVIFENRGALQDFSARIQVAYALNLIGYGAYSDLCILRDIRNAFAHSAESFDFEREDIAALCRKLWFARFINWRHEPEPTTTRGLFEREVEILSGGLYEVLHPIQRRMRFIHLGPPRDAPPTSQKTLKQRVSQRPPTPSQKT